MEPADRLAAEPGMQRLLNAAAARYRTLSRVGGSIELDQLTAAEARAAHHLRLTGRTLPMTGASARVQLGRLDVALADAGGLLAVLRAGGHDLTTAAQRRRAEQAERDAAWDRAAAATLGQEAAMWLQELRAARGGMPPPGLDSALRALALSGRRSAAWDRARLASEVADDPHALDDGTPALALMLAAFAHREQRAVPRDAAARRSLLERHGVLSDPHSSTVLVLGLRAIGRGPAAKLLAAADGGHLVLTLAQLTASALQPVGGIVRTCEGPVVIRGTEARLGNQLVAPLVCTDGQPSAACDALLRQIGGEVRHSGDFEWGGIRVASVMRRRFGARPWRYDCDTYSAALERLPARARALGDPRGLAPAGFASIWQLLADRRVPVWQEDLIDELVEDLRVG